MSSGALCGQIGLTDPFAQGQPSNTVGRVVDGCRLTRTDAAGFRLSASDGWKSCLQRSQVHASTSGNIQRLTILCGWPPPQLVDVIRIHVRGVTCAVIQGLVTYLGADGNGTNAFVCRFEVSLVPHFLHNLLCPEQGAVRPAATSGLECKTSFPGASRLDNGIAVAHSGPEIENSSGI